MVSISGSPAATSEPKASIRMMSVTGHEISSDFIIALRLASLKSDHMPEAPVRLTCTSSVPASFSFPLSASAAATISVVVPFAPALTIAVWPSCEIENPASGSATVATRESSRRMTAARSTVAVNAGSPTFAEGEWTTTIRAALDWPPKFWSISSRACTDCEPEASQPAPERACSTRGANTPRPTASTSHATRTARKWSAVQAPRRPIGPTAVIWGTPASRGRRARRRARRGTTPRRRRATG